MIQPRIFAVRSVPIASSAPLRPAPLRSLPFPVRSGLFRSPTAPPPSATLRSDPLRSVPLAAKLRSSTDCYGPLRYIPLRFATLRSGPLRFVLFRSPLIPLQLRSVTLTSNSVSLRPAPVRSALFWPFRFAQSSSAPFRSSVAPIRSVSLRSNPFRPTRR
jgi:hypothetical protein